MKYCTNCGLQVANEATTCPRCGALTPPSLPQPSEAARTEIATHPDHNAEVYNQASDPWTATTPGNYGPAQPQSPMYLSPPPPPPEGATLKATPQQPSYGAPPQYGFPPYQPPPLSPSRQPKTGRGLSTPMIILLVVLALIIMLGGIGLIFYTTVARPAQLRAQATATMQTILTTDARSTAVANAQATGTAVANANATSTAVAQVTAQAQATTTALQNIYTQATQGTPALVSSLAAQDSYNWDVHSTTDGGGCGFASGSFHATVLSKNFYVPCFAQATHFSNFAYEVQMTINQGNGGGLLFRANSANSQFYIFNIARDGNYSLYVSKDSSHSTSIAVDSASVIKTGLGQPNLLSVVVRGNNIYLYINKQYVGSVSDSTYSSGSIGVFASDTTSNTDVSFSNAKVWTL